MAAEQQLQDLKRTKARLESNPAGEPFTQQKELRQAERTWESAMKRFSDLAEDLVACWRPIERCKAVLAKGPGDGRQLIVQGSGLEVQAIFEETELERLALRKCTSPDFLAEQGWHETDLGEVGNARGRTVFDPGFVSGLRKLLGAS